MKKSDLYGIIGSAVFCLIVLLLLLFIYLPGIQKPEDEGIIVSFGDSYAGGGSMTASSVQTPTPSRPETPAATTPVQNSPDNVLTQEDPSVSLARQEQERRQREQEEAERRRREEERRRQQEEQRRREEEQRRQQQAIDAANALGSAFGTSASDDGSGLDAGSEQQGNPAGRGSSDGNSWSLNGRSLIGSLIKPTYNRNVEGVVTVSIRVNERGEVVSTALSSPSTISDEQTINAAMDAARKTKFSPGRNMVSGTITYNFRLN